MRGNFASWHFIATANSSFALIIALRIVFQQHLPLPSQTAIYSLACTPDLHWMVGGCLDNCVHIWRFDFHEEGLKMLELSCAGYAGRVSEVLFNSSGTLLASNGDSRSTVWDFTGSGPANTVPIATVGHIKKVNCQVCILLVSRTTTN